MGMKNGHCDRCGVISNVFQMSMFNTEECCPSCIKAERARSDYEEAHKAEIEEVRKGNFNFKGVGL